MVRLLLTMVCSVPKGPPKGCARYRKKKRQRTAFIIGKQGVVLECCKNNCTVDHLQDMSMWPTSQIMETHMAISVIHIYTKKKKSKVIYWQQNNNNNNNDAYKEYQLLQQFHKNYNKNYSILEPAPSDVRLSLCHLEHLA